MIYIGIDPGKSGAIAAIQSGEAIVWDCPLVGKNQDFGGMAKLLESATGEGAIAAIEQVCSFGMGRQSAFIFGCNYGAWQALCLARDVPLHLVRPQVWKRAIGLPRQATKDDSRAIAMRLFPQCRDRLTRKKDDGRAEALLLAQWCKISQGDVLT